jgi:hypothetical protein
VVHDVGINACPRRVGRFGDVRADDLDAVREVGSPGSIRSSHPVTPHREMTGHGEAEWTGAEHHMEWFRRHAMAPFS